MSSSTTLVLVAVLAGGMMIAGVLAVLLLNRSLGRRRGGGGGSVEPVPVVNGGSGGGGVFAGEGSSADGPPAKCPDSQATLDLHNTYRKKHGRAPLQWSDRLARSAQKKTDRCIFEHEGARLAGRPVGENLGMGYPSCKAGILDMYESEPKPKGNDTLLPGGGYNHATQILGPATRQVGCGFTQCRNIGPHMACHYDRTQE